MVNRTLTCGLCWMVGAGGEGGRGDVDASGRSAGCASVHGYHQEAVATPTQHHHP